MVSNLRLLRTRKGLTIREVSKMLGIPETELCRIEKGQAYIPPKWRPKIADFFGVPISEICDITTGWPVLVDMEMPKLVRKNISK
ncbi:hypothetical protein AN618_15080 [Fervidicola ferrireducens]|uniref:HTH cro/C1-type domain-containing protein n=1 Tax=Fervidicola ferrireducens TaxID=520764 RepID=A0A140L7U0_9FIRM|nr:hypothetical protein AN618_15080 [Fervidicola ferrireducens]